MWWCLSSLKMDPVTWVHILDMAVDISLRPNSLRKRINPTLLPLVCNHNDLSHSSNTIHIQAQAVSVVSGTNSLLISDFGPWRHEKRDTILKSLCQPYYADNTMLTHLNARRILWCLRSLSVEIRKKRLHLSTVKIQLHLFKMLRFSGPSLPSLTSSSPISCLVVYNDKWWLSYPLRTSVKLHPMTMHLN